MGIVTDKDEFIINAQNHMRLFFSATLVIVNREEMDEVIKLKHRIRRG